MFSGTVVVFSWKPDEASKAVGEIEAAEALGIKRVQLSSNTGPQLLLQESLRNNRNRWISTKVGIWFGTRGADVQILSPRPISSGNRDHALRIRRDWLQNDAGIATCELTDSFDRFGLWRLGAIRASCRNVASFTLDGRSVRYG
jgi:hypothetical protein